MLAVLRVLTFGMWRSEGGRARANQLDRRVWRITDSKPEGEWVDADSAPPAAAVRDAQSTPPLESWATSSMDLLDGVQIVEHTDSQLPDDLRPSADNRGWIDGAPR